MLSRTRAIRIARDGKKHPARRRTSSIATLGGTVFVFDVTTGMKVEVVARIVANRLRTVLLHDGCWMTASMSAALCTATGRGDAPSKFTNALRKVSRNG